jgi:hypothetical protein
MSTERLRCYYCGTSLGSLSLPLRRLDECPSCAKPLHVCRMCVAYDPRVAEACTEDDAIEVRDKMRANFCDYFKPSPQAFRPDEQRRAKYAAAELAALFGDAPDAAATDEPPAPTDDAEIIAAHALFGPPKN